LSESPDHEVNSYRERDRSLRGDAAKARRGWESGKKARRSTKPLGSKVEGYFLCSRKRTRKRKRAKCEEGRSGEERPPNEPQGETPRLFENILLTNAKRAPKKESEVIGGLGSTLRGSDSLEEFGRAREYKKKGVKTSPASS